MTSIGEALDRFRQPLGPDSHAAGPFRLESSLDGPAARSEVDGAWPDRAVPGEAMEFWTMCRGARLFEDMEYGQWGLVLLDPPSSAARTALERAARPRDYRADDIVLGEFLGDQELCGYLQAFSSQGFLQHRQIGLGL